MTDDALGRLLTEHLPPIPDGLATGPTGAALRARARARRHRRLASAGAGLAVVAVAGVAGVAAQHTPPPLSTTSVDAVPGAGMAIDSGRAGPVPPPGVTPQSVPITRVQVSADGRQLAITLYGGACQDQSVTYQQAADRVVLLYEWWPTTPGGACRLSLVPHRVEVRLAEPLGGRQLIDGSNDKRILPRLLGELRRPAYLPPGCVPDPAAPTSDNATAYCLGGGHRVLVTQSYPSQVEPENAEETVTPLGTRTVRGQRATLVLRSQAPKIDPETHRPYIDPSSGRPYEPTRTIVLTWQEGGYVFAVRAERTPYDQDDLVTQVQRVADSVR
jgi:hypothetical protein